MPTAPTVTPVVRTDYYGIRLVISNAETVSRNDIYRKLNGAAASTYVLLGSTSTSQNYDDYEAANATAYDYKVTAVAANGDEASTTVTNQSVTFNTWLMKDPANIVDTFHPFIDNDPLQIETEEDQGKFNPVGRKFPVVIKDDGVKAAEFQINMQFVGDEDFDKFTRMRARQKVLLLQAPMPGKQWHFVFGPRGRENVLNTNDPYRTYTIDIIEVERP